MTQPQGPHPHRMPESPSSSHFEDVLRRIRLGEMSSEEGASELLAQTSQSEQLAMLDGDLPMWPGLAGFFLRGYNHRPLVAGALERLGIPGIRFCDGPRGVVLGRSTCFPVTSARGASWDVALEEEIGRAIGLEARAQGANLCACVSADVLRHPRWGRAQESYGEDPTHVGAMGAALTTGVRNHVMACVKHLGLYAMEDSRFSVDVRVDDEAMRERYLPPFRAVVEAGADAVMSAYNSVNGEWAGQNRTLLTGMLRDEWGFEGFTISDFIWGFRDAVKSLRAGLDVEMPFTQSRARGLPAALKEGAISPRDVERAAHRVLAGQLRQQATRVEPAPPPDVIACDEHRALARRAATEGMVLLRNTSVGQGKTPALPLGLEIGSIALIGPLADRANLGDAGSSSVTPPYTTSLLSGLRAVLPDTRTAYHPGHDVTAAANLANEADAAVVVVGWDAGSENEMLLVNDAEAVTVMDPPLSSRSAANIFLALLAGLNRLKLLPNVGDRQRLTLSAHEEQLIGAVSRANPRTIVVVVSGSIAVMEAWRHRVPAILMAWYPGMEGGRALAEVLAGIVEPGGRLPTAVPADAAHLPEFDNRSRQVRYDRWWGQRKLDRDGHAAAYPFGFGLGYTSFTLRDLTVAVDTGAGLDDDIGSISARVTATNTGKRSGSTVVQLYALAEADAALEHPQRHLLGFAKLRAAAGESLEVSLRGTLRPLARYEAKTLGWRLLTGDYRLEAAQYSGDPNAAIAKFRLDP